MNKLKHFLQREEKAIQVDAALKKQLRDQMHPKRRLGFFALLFPVLGITALALIISTSPLAPTPETSFLKKAQAAYEQAAERAGLEGLVHHTVVEILEGHRAGTTSERWTLPGDQFEYYEASKDGRVYTRAMHKNDVLYVEPEQNALARAAEAEMRSHDSVPSLYTLQTPERVNGTHYEGDPEDPSVMCHSFEWMTDEQIKEQELFQQIMNVEQDNFSIDRMPALLELLEDPSIEDLGELTLSTGEFVHGYRLTTSYTFDAANDSTSIREFYFDPTTYFLVTERWIDINAHGSTSTSDFHFTVNELVQASSFEAAFFTPEGHGLEAAYISPDHPENLPVFELREGCMRADEQNGPEPVYLSPEEEAEARARIRALQGK